jgi:hypothetical protein
MLEDSFWRWRNRNETIMFVCAFVNSIWTFGNKFCFISLTAKVPADFSYFWTIKILTVQNIYTPEEEALFVEFFHFLVCAKENPSSFVNSSHWKLHHWMIFGPFKWLETVGVFVKILKPCFSQWGHNRSEELEHQLKAQNSW